MTTGHLLSRLKYTLTAAKVALQPFYRRKIPATVCGHRTWPQNKIFAFGETIFTRVPVVDGTTLYCHDCLATMSIRCAWCHAPIFVGCHVTLYLAKEDQPLPADAREYFHDDVHRAFVGCLRCADMGSMDAQGIWMPPGVVERMPSGTELALAAFREGASVVIIG